METTIGELLKTVIEQFGAPGIVIGGLAWWGWQTQKRNASLNDALLEITKETVRASEASTAALRENTTTIQNLNSILIRNGKVE